MARYSFHYYTEDYGSIAFDAPSEEVANRLLNAIQEGMVNGALKEHLIKFSQEQKWTQEDEQNYQSILDRLQKEYVKLCVKEKK
jgi:hypothetical protein